MPPKTTSWAAVVFGLALAYLAAYQMFKLPPVLPVLLEAYGYERALAGGFMSVYALVGLLFSVALSRAVERRGWRAMLSGALALFALGNLMALAWPQSGWWVLAARGLEGLGFAVLAIVGPTLANRRAAARHLPVVIGLTATWIPMGQLLASLAAPAALALQGWQSLWFVGLAGCLAMALWARRAPIAADALPVAGARVRDADGEAQRRRRRLLIWAGGVFLLWSCQFFAYMTWLPQYLVEVHALGLSSALAGYALTVAVLMAFNITTGFLLRWGLPLGGLLVFALALQSAVWWLVPAADAGWRGLVSLIAYGIGAGIAPTCLFAMPSAIQGQGHGTAQAFGVIMTGRNIGVFIGPLLLAAILGQTGAWDPAGPVFGASTALAALAAIGLTRAIARR